MSPSTIMTGQMLTEKNVKFQFGDFLQPTEPSKTNNTKNSMDERTSDSIYYRPSGNAQGGLWVYKLSTAQVVHRNTATLAHSNDTITMSNWTTIIVWHRTSAEQGKIGEQEPDEELNVDGVDVEIQGNYFGNANENDYIEDSDENYVKDADDEVTVGNPGVDDTIEIPGVETEEEETGRLRRYTRKPERFADTEHSVVFSRR